MMKRVLLVFLCLSLKVDARPPSVNDPLQEESWVYQQCVSTVLCGHLERIWGKARLGELMPSCLGLPGKGGFMPTREAIQYYLIFDHALQFCFAPRRKAKPLFE